MGSMTAIYSGSEIHWKNDQRRVGFFMILEKGEEYAREPFDVPDRRRARGPVVVFECHPTECLRCFLRMEGSVRFRPCVLDGGLSIFFRFGSPPHSLCLGYHFVIMGVFFVFLFSLGGGEVLKSLCVDGWMGLMELKVTKKSDWVSCVSSLITLLPMLLFRKLIHRLDACVLSRV